VRAYSLQGLLEIHDEALQGQANQAFVAILVFPEPLFAVVSLQLPEELEEVYGYMGCTHFLSRS
jgi:hypothetical protein